MSESDDSSVENALENPVIADDAEFSSTELKSLLEILDPRNNWLSILLLAIPAAAYFSINHNTGLAFIFSMVAIMPLAGNMGKATEEIALRTSESIGGLLNATFGNAAEMIIAVMALYAAYQAGIGTETADTMMQVVQASLIGSILGNLLLVLGLSLFYGGMKYSMQSFNEEASQINGSLLLLAMVGLVLPAAFGMTTSNNSSSGIVEISRWTAFILLGVYGMHLLFQLKTHSNLYATEGHHIEEPELSVRNAAILLVMATIFVALMAEILVHSIEDAASQYGIPPLFIGLILLPMFGNAAEHFTAVTVAGKDKMDLSIGIAIGSSIQIALLVAPLMILIAWGFGLPLTLEFGLFETIVTLMAVLVTNFIVQDGKSNWLEGAMLLATYAIIAISFLYY
jgi:Ca2+:H+ antiporter